MEYGFANQNHSYEDVSGLVVVPRATGDAVVIRLHKAYGVRKVSWSSMRQNRPPEIPKAGDLDNDTYVGGTVSMPLPLPVASGDGYNWIVGGEYLYLQNTNRVADGSVGFPTGAVPFPQGRTDDAARIVGNLEAIPLGEGEGAAALDSIAALGNNSFPWPFTRYPSTLVNPGLIV